MVNFHTTGTSWIVYRWRDKVTQSGKCRADQSTVHLTRAAQYVLQNIFTTLVRTSFLVNKLTDYLSLFSVFVYCSTKKMTVNLPTSEKTALICSRMAICWGGSKVKWENFILRFVCKKSLTLTQAQPHRTRWPTLNNWQPILNVKGNPHSTQALHIQLHRHPTVNSQESHNNVQ